MVMRRSGVVLLAFLVGLFLVVASWPYWSYDGYGPTGAVTGNSIKDAVGTFYEMSSINQRIFILSQIFLLIIIIVAAFIVIGRFKKKDKFVKKNYVVDSKNRRSQTDLDVLYEMLKKRKEVGMEDIERVFRVKPDIALGWAKVLENGDLAEIDYPRFGKPVLRIIEEEKVGAVEGAREDKEKIVKKVVKEDVKKKVVRKVVRKKVKKVGKKKIVRKKAKKVSKKKVGKKKVVRKKR